MNCIQINQNELLDIYTCIHFRIKLYTINDSDGFIIFYLFGIQKARKFTYFLSFEDLDQTRRSVGRAHKARDADHASTRDKMLLPD